MIAIESNNLGLNALNDIGDEIYYLDSGTYVHFSYSGYGDAIVNINIDFDSNVTIMDGDLNFDQSVNIQDIILMVDFILNDIYFNQFQLESGDMTLDGYCNIFDIIIMIDMILD